MKLTIIGGGGFRVPQVVGVLAQPDTPLAFSEVCLYDVSADRLRVIADVLKQSGMGHLPIVTTRNLDDAVSGADFIFSAMRIGGTRGRISDEREALSRGVLGQETVGPGGYAYALRTLPYAMELAEAVHAHAPSAWIINFTNPAGIVTQAMRRVHANVVGICDTPIGLVRRVAALLGVAERDVAYDYIGLNHLGWLRSLVVDGNDLLPQLLADDSLLGRLDEARTLSIDWVRALGMIPNEYLYYYYLNRESVAKLSTGTTRGEFLHGQQGDFYSAALEHPERAAELWTATHLNREQTYMAESRSEGEDRPEESMGGGYERVALDVMTALASGAPAHLILGVPNSDDDGDPLIPHLHREAVVEVPCRVDFAGIHPERPAPFSGPELGLLIQVKACEDLLIEAGLSGDRTAAWRAIASHPLVDSVEVARELVDAYLGSAD